MNGCPLCGEQVVPDDEVSSVPVSTETGLRMAHRECMLRTVLGGIGHLEDHGYWCTKMGDPDGGRTFRQSAIEVDAWVHRHGTESGGDLHS